MPENSQTEESFGDLSLINWVGIAGGALMLVLPFLGAWWKAIVGENVMSIAFSPFFYKANILGVTYVFSSF